MSDKPKLMEILQNSWHAIVKIIKLMKVNEKLSNYCWLKETRKTWQLIGKYDSNLDLYTSKDSIDTLNETSVSFEDSQ